MVNLKQKRTTEPESLLGDAKTEDAYPYGLVLHLDEDTLTKLGVKGLPAVGAKVRVVAMAEVQSVSQHDSKGGAHRSVSLQITDMERPKTKGGMYENSDMED